MTPASVSRPLLLVIETLASLNFALRFRAFVKCALRRIQLQREPRNFDQDLSGPYLVVANQAEREYHYPILKIYDGRHVSS